jgi:cell division protein FtsB
MEALQRKVGYTMAKKGYVLKFRTKLLLTLLFLSYFLFLLFQQSFEMQAQQAAISQLQQAISQAQHENEVLLRQIEHTKSQEYIEQAARERLGWVKEGETIFIEKKD